MIQREITSFWKNHQSKMYIEWNWFLSVFQTNYSKLFLINFSFPTDELDEKRGSHPKMERIVLTHYGGMWLSVSLKNNKN